MYICTHMHIHIDIHIHMHIHIHIHIDLCIYRRGLALEGAAEVDVQGAERGALLGILLQYSIS